MERQIAEVQKEIERYSKPLSPEDEKKMEQIKDLEAKISEQEATSESYQKKIRELSSTFEALKVQ